MYLNFTHAHCIEVLFHYLTSTHPARVHECMLTAAKVKMTLLCCQLHRLNIALMSKSIR